MESHQVTYYLFLQYYLNRSLLYVSLYLVLPGVTSAITPFKQFLALWPWYRYSAELQQQLVPMPKALLQGIPQCPPRPSSEPCGYRPRALCTQLLQCPLAVMICLCWTRGHLRPWTKKKPSSPHECCLGITLGELLPLDTVTAQPTGWLFPTSENSLDSQSWKWWWCQHLFLPVPTWPCHGCAGRPPTLPVSALRAVGEAAVAAGRMRRKSGFIGQPIFWKPSGKSHHLNSQTRSVRKLYALDS